MRAFSRLAMVLALPGVLLGNVPAAPPAPASSPGAQAPANIAQPAAQVPVPASVPVPMIVHTVHVAQSVAPGAPRANGAIFQAANGYRPLTYGQRAGSVGDVLTIVLVERMQGNTVSSTGTDRNGSIGLSPPTAGPLSILSAADTEMGGNSTFAGRGNSAQGNSLSGEVTVTVTEVLPNGTLRVSGQKRVRINRGNETVRVTGLVRLSDVGADNRVLSTRVAEAEIDYLGRGEVARASRQGWLQRFFSSISPF
jgi:flagellar L-ring protein FlgH